LLGISKKEQARLSELQKIFRNAQWRTQERLGQPLISPPAKRHELRLLDLASSPLTGTAQLVTLGCPP
jgi:hypothetical protein